MRFIGNNLNSISNYCERQARAKFWYLFGPTYKHAIEETLVFKLRVACLGKKLHDNIFIFLWCFLFVKIYFLCVISHVSNDNWKFQGKQSRQMRFGQLMEQTLVKGRFQAEGNEILFKSLCRKISIFLGNCSYWRTN